MKLTIAERMARAAIRHFEIKTIREYREMLTIRKRRRSKTPCGPGRGKHDHIWLGPSYTPSERLTTRDVPDPEVFLGHCYYVSVCTACYQFFVRSLNAQAINGGPRRSVRISAEVASRLIGRFG